MDTKGGVVVTPLFEPVVHLLQQQKKSLKKPDTPAHNRSLRAFNGAPTARVDSLQKRLSEARERPLLRPF